MMSLAQAMEPSDEARLICHSTPPQKVLFANKAWTKLTGFEQHELEGHTLRHLQGPMTDTTSIQQLLDLMNRHGHAEGEVVNFKKDGSPYKCNLTIHPVWTSSLYGETLVSHFVVIVQPILVAPPKFPDGSECSFIEPSLSSSGSSYNQGSKDDAATDRLLQHLSQHLQRSKML